MPNSLKCRLKRLVHKGLLSEKDLSRLYTDNDVIEELEKIKAEFEDKILLNQTVAIQIMDKHIAELKEENKEYEAEVITRGNCMICEKELTEGLFFCKDCKAKANNRK